MTKSLQKKKKRAKRNMGIKFDKRKKLKNIEI